MPSGRIEDGKLSAGMSWVGEMGESGVMYAFGERARWATFAVKRIGSDDEVEWEGGSDRRMASRRAWLVSSLAERSTAQAGGACRRSRGHESVPEDV